MTNGGAANVGVGEGGIEWEGADGGPAEVGEPM